MIFLVELSLRSEDGCFVVFSLVENEMAILSQSQTNVIVHRHGRCDWLLGA